jgi:hypothetical protein
MKPYLVMPKIFPETRKVMINVNGSMVLLEPPTLASLLAGSYAKCTFVLVREVKE